MDDRYEGFADRYDWMNQKNSSREEFFRRLFVKNKVSKVLDCACGTGIDLLMFHFMGLKIYGSDASDAMLEQARMKIGEIKIPLLKSDYRELAKNYTMKFDAVVCLTNSINEILEDSEVVRALLNMKKVLRDNGLLIFDQGQTDSSMQNPPRFAPILNNRDYTRFFVMDYDKRVQTVNIFDFIHTEDKNDFKYFSVKLSIRLVDDWQKILQDAKLDRADFFGDWDFTPYDKKASRRLIAVVNR